MPQGLQSAIGRGHDRDHNGQHDQHEGDQPQLAGSEPANAAKRQSRRRSVVAILLLNAVGHASIPKLRMRYLQ